MSECHCHCQVVSSTRSFKASMISTEAGTVAEESVRATILWSLWSTEMASSGNLSPDVLFDSWVFLWDLKSSILSSQPSLPNGM